MQGKELKVWRRQQNWTLEEAARYIGTTKTTVYRWESGRHHIPKTIDILVLLLCEKKNIRKVQNFLYSPLAQ